MGYNLFPLPELFFQFLARMDCLLSILRHLPALLPLVFCFFRNFLLTFKPGRQPSDNRLASICSLYFCGTRQIVSIYSFAFCKKCSAIWQGYSQRSFSFQQNYIFSNHIFASSFFSFFYLLKFF